MTKQASNTFWEAFPLSLNREFLALLALLFLLTELIFGGLFGIVPLFQPLAYLPFVPLVWITLRHGRWEATAAGALVGVLATTGTLRGYGPFVSGSQGETLILAAIYAGAVIATPLLWGGNNRLRGRTRKQEELQEGFAWRVINALGQGVTIVNADKRFEFVNPAYAEMVGRAPEELVGMSPFEVTHPEDRAIMQQAAEERWAGQATTYETRLLRPDGRVTHVLITGVPRRKDDEIAGSFTIVTDVTQQKETEAELRHREAQLRLLLEQMPAVLWTTDTQLRFTSSAGAGLAALGLAPNQLRGVSMQTYFQTGDPAFPPLGAHLCALAGEPTSFESKWHEHTFQAHVEPLLDAEGDIVGVVGAALDVTALKAAEKALQQREAQYRAVVNSVLDVIFQTDADGTWTFLNQAWTDVTGFDVEESLGENFLGYIHPDDRERSLAEFAPLIEKHKDYCRHTVRYLTQAGDFRWIEVHARRLEADDGAILGTTGLLHDVTERKRAEEKLRHEKKFAEAVIDSLPGIFYLCDEYGHMLRWNKSLEMVSGYAADELAQLDPLDLIAEKDRAYVAGKIEEVLARGQATTEADFLLKDGTSRAYLFTGRKLQIEAHTCILGMGIDVTERRQRERELECFVTVSWALRHANSRARMLPIILDQVIDLLQAGGAMFVVHPDERSKLIELARGDWQPLSKLELPPGTGVADFEADTAMIYTSDDIRQTLDFDAVDQLAPHFAMMGAPLRDEDDIMGVIWIGRERPFTAAEERALMAIAEIAANALSRSHLLETLEQQVRERTQKLAAANEQLRELDYLKTKFIDDISHELRTPITAINLYLNLIKKAPPGRRDRYLETLEKQTQRLRQMVENILEFSRVDALVHETAPTQLDLNDLIARIIAKYRAEAQTADLTLETSLSPQLPPIVGIDELLIQAVTHLLDNAVKYTPEGSIDVKTYYDAEREMVGLQIADTGIGIDNSELAHVFDRFYRGRHIGQLSTPGAGLGLALAQQIVMQHQGRIALESEVDQGTMVRVWLPPAGESVAQRLAG